VSNATETTVLCRWTIDLCQCMIGCTRSYNRHLLLTRTRHGCFVYWMWRLLTLCVPISPYRSVTHIERNVACLYFSRLDISIPTRVLRQYLLYISVSSYRILRIRMHCRWSVCTDWPLLFENIRSISFQSVLPLRIHLWWPCKRADCYGRNSGYLDRPDCSGWKSRYWFDLSDTLPVYPSLTG
jgi:hypothetical protein